MYVCMYIYMYYVNMIREKQIYVCMYDNLMNVVCMYACMYCMYRGDMIVTLFLRVNCPARDTFEESVSHDDGVDLTSPASGTNAYPSPLSPPWLFPSTMDSHFAKAV